MLSSPQQKPPLKEKFVVLTEHLFQSNEPYNTNDQAAFWDEFLMLPVNISSLTELIQSKPEESLLAVSNNITRLFETCLNRLVIQEPNGSSKSDQIRQQHAIQILACLMRQLFLKKRLSHFNIIQLLSGLDKADTVFGKLVKNIHDLLGDPSTRSSALLLAINLSAGNDNVNQNNLNTYFMQHDISDALIKIIDDDQSTMDQVHDTVMLWGMLANYNKREIKNAYLTRLTRCKNNRVLENFVILFTNVLLRMTDRYIQLKNDNETLTQSMVNYMASWFSGPASKSATVDLDDIEAAADLPPYESSLFLVLYDLITANPHFVAIMLHQSAREDKTGPTFLASFISYASYLFQHNRNPRAFLYTRLMLTILLSIVENQSIMNYMAKEQNNEFVRICRQRPTPLPLVKKDRSLFCSILDVMLIFLKYNIRKKLDIVTYKLAFACIHRILVYLNNRSIQLQYHWVEVWPIITATVHFIATHLQDLELRDGFDSLVTSIMDVINLCTAHGESFLSDTTSYDMLFYEIIRASNDFNTLASYVSQTTFHKAPGDRSSPLSQSDFANVKLICNHFKPVLDEWQETQKAHFLTPDKVLGIINEHYDTLELGPVGKADQYTPYHEIPAEMAFFRHVLRTATTDYIAHITQSPPIHAMSPTTPINSP
ncbi:DUF1741-domain-containing protein [Lichtheimia hyalospora FSU 10163]|nr:DUF1741-domain-containing protein [Lichtheimia hyalospora FSU 10163]